MIPLILAVHTIAAVVWVGGMYFAVAAFEPALRVIPEPLRLTVWREAFKRFFRWAWVCLTAILLSGYTVVYYGYEGFAAAGLHIHIMQISGLLMVFLFVAMWCTYWQEFRHAIEQDHEAAAEHALRRMRQVTVIILVLGLFTSAIGATGGFWSY